MSADVEIKIRNFFAQYPLRSYQKGQILIHAGDDSSNIYYLESGKVRQYDISYRGDEIIVNIFKKASFFPLLSHVSGLSNKYFFDVESPIEARTAPAIETIEFIKSNPDVMFDLLKRLYIGMDGLLGRLIHQMSGSARSRLIYEIIIECKRFGEIQTDNSYKININEADLGSRAGLSRETVSREIRKLNKDDLIVVSHKVIQIKNINELYKKLQNE
jgi:CRP-like cAMP-binding protein